MEDKELLEAWVDKYLDRLAEEAARENLSPRLKSPRPSADLDDFMRLVGQALKRQQQIDGSNKLLLFTEEFPEKDDNIEGEVITYSLENRLPGTVEQVPQGQAMNPSNRRERVRRLREVLNDPDNPGSRIYIHGQWFDNIVRFDIHARTNKTANKRAIWFEQFMDDWTWYLKANGVAEVRYEGRGGDGVRTPENRKVAVRPLFYYVRTEKITVTREHALRSLIIASSLE